MFQATLASNTFQSFRKSLVLQESTTIDNNLSVQFKKGNRFSKITCRENGSFIITMPLKGFKLSQNDVENLRQSFIHEYIHYLDFNSLTIEELKTISTINLENENSYYNNHWEFLAYSKTFLFLLQEEMDLYAIDKMKTNTFEKLFGKSETDFLKVTKFKQYYPTNFMKFLSDSKRFEINSSMLELYNSYS